MFGLPVLFAPLMALPDAARIALSLALIAPLALFMGMPFPLVLARLKAQAPDFVPWAWGINGCASVASAILATLLTIGLGARAVVLIAAALYLLAAAIVRRSAHGRRLSASDVGTNRRLSNVHKIAYASRRHSSRPTAGIEGG